MTGLFNRKKKAPATDLDWVDGFIESVRPYVRVRPEDNLLIRMPNVAHRLNDQGVRVLGFLLEGGTSDALLAQLKGPEQVRDVALFLGEVRRCLEGKLREDKHSCAVEVEPLELNFSELPVLSEVALTSRCNLRCVFCYAGCGCSTRAGGGESGPAGAHSRQAVADGGRGVSLSSRADAHRSRTAAPDMSTAEVKEVLRRIRLDAKVPSVSFTGGEPTLRDDLCELVAFARELDFRINLITNGTRMSRRLARRLARAGLHSAQVSLEGTTAAAHEVITGVRGSFRRSVEAVAHLERAGIGVHTNTTLNLRNLGEAPLLPRFVRRKLGRERLSMNLVIPSGTAAAAEGLLLRYSEVGPVVEEVMAASEAAGVEFMRYSPTPLCIFNPIIHGLGNKGCSACDGLLSVDARGDVLPCSSFPEPVGNLLEQDFARIWHSSRAADLRQKSLAYGSCRDCDSFAACHGACPLYWRHFGFGELEGRFVSSIDSLRRLAV